MTQPGAGLPPAAWNDTAHPFEDDISMVDLVARRVAADGDAVAVRGDGESLSYRQLWSRAGKLAAFLTARGVGRGDHVGILVDNSTFSIVAVLGVLRSGAAYVPLDTRWPAARIAKPLRTLGVGWIVTAPAWSRLSEQAVQDAGLDCRFVCAWRTADDESFDGEALEMLWDHIAESEDLSEAAGFNHFPGEDFSADHIDTYVRRVRDLVLADSVPRVVEVGCGAGLIARALKDGVAGYTGLDLSRVAVRRAEYEFGDGGRFCYSSADELEEVVPPEEADVVVLASVAQFFPDYEYTRTVLSQALSLVGPGGRVVIADVVPPGPDAAPAHLTLSPAWFARLAAHTGLDVTVEILERSEADWHPVLADRYDVVLTRGHAPAKPPTPVVTHWYELSDADHTDPGIAATDTAYVIFTSGSTGAPKGVSVCHRSAVNLIQWVNDRYRVGPGDELLWVTALTFDLSVYDILGILSAGATVRVAPPRELADPERVLQILRTEPITFWDSAPAALSLVMSVAEEDGGDIPRLRLVFLSGDWVPLPLPDAVRAHFPEAKVVALGGATEATIWSNYFDVDKVDPAWPSIPYGYPIHNGRYYVLDADRQVCPIGAEGDLYIAGTVVAQGYAGDPGLTAAKFLPDLVTGGDERMYSTGDRAKWTENGYLEFLGRRDDQVKVRGYRIELGDILAALREVPGVTDCAVTTVDQGDGPELVAAAAVGNQESRPTVASLRRELARRLPGYMVPEHILPMPTLPVGATGKVDRAAIAAAVTNRARG